MPDSPKSDLDALNAALNALTNLHVAISLVSKYLGSIHRHVRTWDDALNFDLQGKFIGISRKGSEELEYSADSVHCIQLASDCEWLPKHIEMLWKEQPAADNALGELPPHILQKLDALIGKPWLASARLHCLDKMLAWPGEVHPQLTFAAEKVLGPIPELLEKAGKHDPYPTWKNFETLILEYKRHLIAVRDAAQPKSDERDADDELVTREWIAEHSGIPAPTIRGPRLSKILGPPDERKPGKPAKWKKAKALEFIANHKRRSVQ